MQRHNIKGVNIAGFDVIRVLGKGSFGVVRLVTERAASADDDSPTRVSTLSLTSTLLYVALLMDILELLAHKRYGEAQLTLRKASGRCLRHEGNS